MNAGVLGIALRTALGDLEQTVAGLHAGRSAFSPSPPYATEGLANSACALVADLPRDRPAEHLLRSVVRDALMASELPPGSRVGLVVGTSSGNIAGPWESWHIATLEGRPTAGAGVGRDTPTLVVAAELGLAPAATLSVACVSGTAALAVAQGWLQEDVVDAVVVAGVDALCRYVHAGFSALGALASNHPRPFQADRDGLVLGEGAAALVLAKQGGTPWLTGTAIASDAQHLTAPSRDGVGAVAALGGAIGEQRVDLVSVHGTGTVFNDAAEVRALEQVFPDGGVAVHGVKHLIGHTMGAAGAIEAVLLVHALRTGESPPSPEIETATATDDAGPRVAAFQAAVAPQTGVSISAAFGGLNAAACFSHVAVSSSPARPAVARVEVQIQVPTDPDWQAQWPGAPRRFHRLDRYSRTALLGLFQLIERTGPLPTGTALVLATPTGCCIADLEHHERLVREGARNVSRLAFTYTIVHAPLAEATLIWQLTGPQLAFVGDRSVAEDEARRWVAFHGAPAAVALWVDAPATDAPSRATAVLWSPEA